MLRYNEKKISPSLTSKLISTISYELVKEVKVGKDFTYSISSNSEHRVLVEEIVDELLSSIPLNNACVGFVKNKSYLDLLEPHKKSDFFVRLDVSSFFHSILIDDISSALKPYIPFEFLDKEKKIKTITRILSALTYKVPDTSGNVKCKGLTILPMGFPSSPVVSNIVFRKIDIQIQKYCEDNKIIYTRYADDMLFSSNSEFLQSSDFKKKIQSLVSQLSLKLNDRKTIMTSGHISLNGYVVDGDAGVIRLSNEKLSKINKITHLLLIRKISPIKVAEKLYGYDIRQFKFKYQKSQDFYDTYCKDQLFNKIVGYRSYLISLLKYDSKHNCLCPSFVKKSDTILKRLNIIIESWS